MNCCNCDCCKKVCLIVTFTYINLIIILLCVTQVYNNTYKDEKKSIVGKFDDKSYNESKLNQTFVDIVDYSKAYIKEIFKLEIYYIITSKQSKILFQENISQLIDSGVHQYLNISFKPIFPQVEEYHENWSYYCESDNKCKYSKVHGCAIDIMSQRKQDNIETAQKETVHFISCMMNSIESYEYMKNDLMFQCADKTSFDIRSLVICMNDDSIAHNILENSLHDYLYLRTEDFTGRPLINLYKNGFTYRTDNVNLLDYICRILDTDVPECSNYEQIKSYDMEYIY